MPMGQISIGIFVAENKSLLLTEHRTGTKPIISVNNKVLRNKNDTPMVRI